ARAVDRTRSASTARGRGPGGHHIARRSSAQAGLACEPVHRTTLSTARALSRLAAVSQAGVAERIPPRATNALSLAAADLNGDGKPDLVVGHGAGIVSVLLGHGDGTFAPHVDYTAGAGAFSVAVADFNGDGKPDIAASDYANGAVSVLVGNGDG